MTATIDQSVSPLLDARQQLADAIATDSGYTCHDSFTAGFATPCYVLTGAGWAPDASGIILYRVQVTCLYADQAGQLVGGVEELARLAHMACIDFGARVDSAGVPAPGTLTLSEAPGAREYAAVQFTVEIPVTLRSI